MTTAQRLKGCVTACALLAGACQFSAKATGEASTGGETKAEGEASMKTTEAAPPPAEP